MLTRQNTAQEGNLYAQGMGIRPGQSKQGRLQGAAQRRREELAGLQLRLKEARLPVIVLLEGWGAAGKGSAIRSLIKELDPRFYKVLCVGMPTEEEQRWPFLKRHFASIPEEGKLLFLDSGWMDETVRLRLRGDLSDAEYARRLESINTFERQLTAGGYLLVKFFFHLTQKASCTACKSSTATRTPPGASAKTTGGRTRTTTGRSLRSTTILRRPAPAPGRYSTAHRTPSRPSWTQRTGCAAASKTLWNPAPCPCSPSAAGR